MSNELTTTENVQSLVNSVEKEFMAMCTDAQKAMFKQEALFAMQAVCKSDFAKSTALGNPQSLKNAVMNVAATGLTLNPVRKLSYLVPRDKAIHLDVSYIGLVYLATESGAIAWVKADCVYKKDIFKLMGIDAAPRHEYDPFETDRGPVIGVYCVAKTNDGNYLTDVMAMDEITYIRGRTQAWQKFEKGEIKSCPWSTDFTEMAKKTVVKRASKMWPHTDKTQRLESAIAALDAHEGVDFEKEKEQEAIEIQKEQELKKEIRKETIDPKVAQDQIKDIISLLGKCNIAPDEKVKFVQEHLGCRTGDFNKKTNAELETFKTILREYLEEKEQTVNFNDIPF